MQQSKPQAKWQTTTAWESRSAKEVTGGARFPKHKQLLQFSNKETNNDKDTGTYTQRIPLSHEHKRTQWRQSQPHEWAWRASYQGSSERESPVRLSLIRGISGRSEAVQWLRTLHFHWRGRGSDLWWMNYDQDSASQAVWPTPSTLPKKTQPVQFS